MYVQLEGLKPHHQIYSCYSKNVPRECTEVVRKYLEGGGLEIELQLWTKTTKYEILF